MFSLAQPLNITLEYKVKELTVERESIFTKDGEETVDTCVYNHFFPFL